MATVEIPERYNASTLLDGNLEKGRADKVAIHCGDDSVTYGELYSRACRIAGMLGELGVQREQRVILFMHDTPWFPAAFLGAIRAGAVPIPLNTHYGPEDFRFFVRDSYARLVICDEALLDGIDRVVGTFDDVRLVVSNGAAEGLSSLTDLIDDLPEDVPPEDTHKDDPAFWLYTSGSTGTSKGVVHLQHDMLYTCETYAREVLGITDEDVTFSAAKAYHAYGLGNSVSFPYWAGATTVLMPEPPEPKKILDIVRRHQPTLFFGVPTLYNAILDWDDTREEDFASVRACPSAAEPLPPDVFRRWKDRFGTVILDGVGSTEMLHIYCSNRVDDYREGTSGKAVPGYELRILDMDENPVEEGEAGNLHVKGDSALAYYWHRHEKTKDELSGHWFFTGDRYRKDEDGYYVYEGRADDMIKVSGLWVSPIEVENTLMDHRDVSEAAVVGLPVEGFTKIKAYVITAKGVAPSEDLKDELREWCKEHLQRYQFPHYIDFVEDFPRTPTGKIRRFKLRQREREQGMADADSS